MKASPNICSEPLFKKSNDKLFPGCKAHSEAIQDLFKIESHDGDFESDFEREEEHERLFTFNDQEEMLCKSISEGDEEEDLDELANYPSSAVSFGKCFEKLSTIQCNIINS